MTDHFDARLRLALEKAKRTQRLFWRDLCLVTGDQLILQTEHTRYCLRIEHAGERHCLVTSDGAVITAPTRLAYVGSNPSFGSGAIMAEAIAIGLPCELCYLKDVEAMIAEGGPRPLYLTTLLSVRLIKRGSTVELPLLPVVALA